MQRCQPPDDFLHIHLHVLLLSYFVKIKEKREEWRNVFPWEGKGQKHLKEEINTASCKWISLLETNFQRTFLIESLWDPECTLIGIPSGEGKQKHKKADEDLIFKKLRLGSRSEFHRSSYFSSGCIIPARYESAISFTGKLWPLPPCDCGCDSGTAAV